MADANAKELVAELAFTAPDGARWTAREYSRLGTGPFATHACLVFYSDSAVRRINTFPANWIELAPEELFRLSWTS